MGCNAPALACVIGNWHPCAPKDGLAKKSESVKTIVSRLITATLIALAAVGFVYAQAERSSGVVMSVSDGDTIIVRKADGLRVHIRLQGIDAPERTMPYSQISRRNLKELVDNKKVFFDPQKLDRHGRTVAVVYLENGTDVCLEQLRAGLAWHFKRYEHEQTPEERAAYSAAEAIAKAARKGLWREESPTPPWEFRASTRSIEDSLSR